MTQIDPKTGVLLVNLGTPDAPTVSAVRRYLAEFLWDPRVVEIPRPIWWLLLHGLILRIRPRESAKAYLSIWLERGSPLKVLTEDLAQSVRREIAEQGRTDVIVKIAMRYGKPAIRPQLEKLKAAGVGRIVILPLYPQYSAAATATVFDAVAESFRRWRHIPELTFISDYHLNDGYIDAVSASICEFWKANGKAPLLLFSFHGLPERSRALGDPYYQQCLASARRIAEKLELPETAWKVAFQSRFGRAEWIKPYCVELLKELAAQGFRTVDLVCPGFAVDCLETLEEIAIANKAVFLQAGGVQYRYIPALNSRVDHARTLVALLPR